MKQIIVSVTNDITTDQRVHKVCTTLIEMNFNVTVIGRKLKNSIPLKRAYNTYRFHLVFNKGFLFYAEYNFRLFFKLLFTKKDILLANDLDTLLPNYLVSRISKSPLVYDSHELFSELPSVQGKFSQKIWRILEKWLVPKQKYFFTVSTSIANWYENKHNNKPLVLKNVPKYQNTSFYESEQKYILYQGALNRGRGLIALLDALQKLDTLTLVIAGDGPLKLEITQKIKSNNLQNRVKLLGNISPEKLVSITQKATLGISIEEDLGLSYRYALPNKLFDYIQAKTPVVATYLPEIKKVVENYEIGEIIKNHSPDQIAETIKKVILNGKLSYKNKLEIAAKELIWERQDEILRSVFKNI